MRKRTLALVAAAMLTAAIALPSGARAAAPKPGVFAGTLGAKVPPGGTARVRAIDRRTGIAVGNVAVARNGAFRLSLPPGVYLVVSTTITGNRTVRVSKVGVSLRAGQRRVGATLDPRKNRRAVTRRPARPARATWRQERGQIAPGRIAVEIPDLTSTSRNPEWNTVRTALNDVLVTETMNAPGACDGIDFLEVDRRDDLVKELEFQRSRYFDQSRRVTRNFIIGDVEVRGTVGDVAGVAGAGEVTLRIIDRAGGTDIGTVTGRIGRDTFFADLTALGERLADELCALTDVYEVTMDVRGLARFATHDANATVRTTITARRGGEERAVWRGLASTLWEDLSFVSKTPCAYVSPMTTEFVWSVEIRLVAENSLTVTWGQENLGPTSYPTASMVCAGGPPVPGQPGPSFVGATPQTFTLPAGGGSVAVRNGITQGDLGYFNTGTVTVTPRGVARRR